MSKYFLVSRAVILVALLFILTAVAWGWAHDSKPAASGEANHLERYTAKRPGGNTTLFFVISLSLGVVLVSFSIWLEWMRTHRGSGGAPPAVRPPAAGGGGRDGAAGEAAKDVPSPEPEGRRAAETFPRWGEWQ